MLRIKTRTSQAKLCTPVSTSPDIQGIVVKGLLLFLLNSSSTAISVLSDEENLSSLLLHNTLHFLLSPSYLEQIEIISLHQNGRLTCSVVRNKKIRAKEE
jgi:hypothetical protein